MLLGIALLTCWLTYTTGRQLGMATLVSTRHAFYSLPYAVSSLYFGADGYVILRDVAAVFITAAPNVSNDTITQAMALTPARDAPMYFSGDDKGDADFAIMAIRMFGPRVESLYDAWFVLLGAAIVLFAAGHWREGPLMALCATTLAIYTAFFALPLTSELGSIQNPRVFGMVSLVSVFHLSLAMIDRRPLTPWHAGACAAQALLIAMSIHVRTPEVWQAMAVFGVGAWLLVRWRLSHGWSWLWPAAILAAALVTLHVYQRASMADVYKTTHLQHRTMWHNVVMGFALNPTLAQRYDLMVDDLPVITLVRKHLAATNRRDEIDRIFRPAGIPDHSFSGIAQDYARYERTAREVTIDIAWSNKWDAVTTFFYYKPRVLWRNLAWAAGYEGYSVDELYLSGQAAALIPARDRAARSTSLNLFRPWTLIAVAAIAWLGRGLQPQAVPAGLAALACWIAVLSLLPVMLAYPTISSLGTALATIPLAMLTTILFLLSSFNQWHRA